MGDCHQSTAVPEKRHCPLSHAIHAYTLWGDNDTGAKRESLSLNGLLKKAVGPCQLW